MNATTLPMGFGVGLVPGVFAGSAVTAILTGEFRIQRFGTDTPMERYLIGAVLMGFGAMLAGGCAVGAGMSGGAVMALTAWLAVFCMWVGRWPCRPCWPGAAMRRAASWRSEPAIRPRSRGCPRGSLNMQGRRHNRHRLGTAVAPSCGAGGRPRRPRLAKRICSDYVLPRGRSPPAYQNKGHIMETIVICSGGLDSVSLAHKVAAERRLRGLLSFNYGQRHVKEVDCAAACARRLGVPHEVVDISGVGRALSGSALTDDVAVPDGHYAEETMKLTIVPNRNAIMLAIAFGMAAAEGADAVAAAVHGGDHFIYPDCRPGFVDAFQAMQDHALEGVADIRLYTPFVTSPRPIS